MTLQSIVEIETVANAELKKIFDPLQAVYLELYNYVKENGKEYLEDVNLEIISENGVESVWIEDQSLDYFLQKEENGFRLFSQLKDQPKMEIFSAYHYPDLHHFYIIFESLMLEIGKGDFFTEDSGMMFYRLERKVGKMFDGLFKKEEKELLELYPKLKEAGTPSAYTTRFTVYSQEQSDEVDKTMDLIAKKFNLNFTMTDEEKEETNKRDALILKRPDDAFVLVIQSDTDTEREKDVRLELCYTKEVDKNFPSLEFLMNDYSHYKCRPMFKYQYSIRTRTPLKGGTAKKVEHHHYSDHEKSIYYFSQLEKFFEEWEKAKEAYHQTQA